MVAYIDLCVGGEEAKFADFLCKTIPIEPCNSSAM